MASDGSWRHWTLYCVGILEHDCRYKGMRDDDDDEEDDDGGDGSIDESAMKPGDNFHQL